MHKNYQGKNQVKIDNRMNKYKEKNRQKHSDEIARINDERMRKLEKEMAGYEKPSKTIVNSNTKYIALGIFCFAVMLFCAFHLLQRKANN